jgi:methionyl-tRNA formyltransferase
MRLMLFGDLPGISQLLEHLPPQQVVGVVAASIRPQYHAELEGISVQLGVPLLIQPRVDAVDYAEFRDAVANLNPDLIWVNSYSMIVRDDVMSLARLGGINIHAALLPKYRGCNPIQWAIINGERHAGVTLHEMTSGLDEGPIIDQRTVPILLEDTWLTVRDRIKNATDDLIRSNLANVLSGQWSRTRQDNAQASYGRRRTKEDGEFSWQDSVLAICNKIRALLPPLPPAYYLSEQGERIEQQRFMTPMAVTVQKYGPAGRCALDGAQVKLRPPNAGDAALLEEWMLHPEPILVGSPFASLPRHPEEAMRYFLEVQTNAVILVVEALSDRAVKGAVMLGEINWHHRHAEMHVFMRTQTMHEPAAWSDAAELLCLFGFRELDLKSITTRLPWDQKGMITALTRNGFEEVGVLRRAAWLNDRWCDIVQLRLAQVGERP